MNRKIAFFYLILFRNSIVSVVNDWNDKIIDANEWVTERNWEWKNEKKNIMK